jgi:hypothetical protein
MGRYFTDFDEAWQFFLNRDEPLEDFFAPFPGHESYVLCWLLEFEAGLVPRVRSAQRAFAPLSWITQQPEHFLHTSIAPVAVCTRPPTGAEITAAADRARRAWSGVQRFEVQYRRVNCFHDAVVVEAAGDGPKTLVSRLVEVGYWDRLAVDGVLGAVDPQFFLPHLTIGAINERVDASGLRDALVPLRELDVGAQNVLEVMLCVVPASRATILTPWTVVARVRFA